MYQAMYMQYGNQLRLQSDIVKNITVPKGQRNYVILIHKNKRRFEDVLSRKKEALMRAGFQIIENQIRDSLWYK